VGDLPAERFALPTNGLEIFREIFADSQVIDPTNTARGAPVAFVTPTRFPQEIVRFCPTIMGEKLFVVKNRLVLTTWGFYRCLWDSCGNHWRTDVWIGPQGASIGLKVQASHQRAHPATCGLNDLLVRGGAAWWHFEAASVPNLCQDIGP
jgi:hypothetical protein